MTIRRLVLILGDQLDANATALTDFDPSQDLLWMAEVSEESTHVRSSRVRIALFLSAMRHFAEELRSRGWPLEYHELADGPRSLAQVLSDSLERHRPRGLMMTAPGDYRVLASLRACAERHGLGLEVRADAHFFSSPREFAEHARGRKQLRMQYFYREQRRRHRVLMQGDKPEGGEFNFDEANRQSFARSGPPLRRPPPKFSPDASTRRVLALVRERFSDHPGDLSTFSWPVTRAEALGLLADFVEHRLPSFGPFQDALWPEEPFLWHSLLSSSLNLKLLNPREVVQAAETAYREGRVPLASAEGFIRQILGWREYVRGIYWTQMPAYLERNALGAQRALPALYWHGRTEMACLADALQQTLRLGYAHHIQRLMVTGLFALLYGVRPQEVHQWYLAVYVDAVEWVELPNTLGMSQYGDGGLLGSKPYVATGKYIEKMSSGRFCARCPFRPAERSGSTACPFTTLYWEFLERHEEMLRKNPRMLPQLNNLGRVSSEERAAVRTRAAWVRASLAPSLE